MMAILLNSNKRVKFKGYLWNNNPVVEFLVPHKILDKVFCWIEIGQHIVLSNISPTKSLTQALNDYFYSTQWSSGFFLKIDCDNCEGVTIYGTPRCVPFASGSSGQLVCPHCGQPWLTYKYGE